jgi:acetyl esterase/lipase
MGLATLLTGCASAGIDTLNAVEPAWSVTVVHDSAYGPGPRQSLDVYAPKRSGPGAPVVVFFYGGGWDSGEKGMYPFVGKALASHGYVAVVPDYRIYPEGRYPDFLVDAAKAVKWARDHARDYGGDPNRLFLMGHSAGAYNAVMLALDKRWLGAEGMDPGAAIKGVVGLAGPYDFLPLTSPRLMAIFGPEDQRPATQPINHVAPGAPPMLLIHDLGDTVVYPRNTEHLAAKLAVSGDPVETRYYKGLNHALVIGAFATPIRFLAPVFRDVTGFIDRIGAAPQAK